MKISFDFDGVLSIPSVQDYAKGLINRGFELWVTTSRYDESNKHKFIYSPTNEDLFTVCDDLGIPRDRIIFTNMTIKFKYLDNSFILHIDDQFMELKYIELNTSIKPIYVGMGNDWRKDCEDVINTP